MKFIMHIMCFIFLTQLHAQRSDFESANFNRADTIAMRYQGEALTNLPILVLRLTAQLETDAEKFRAIYYWVTHNVKGNYHLMSTNDHKRSQMKDDPEAYQVWMAMHRKEVFEKLRNDKETLCAGFAFLIQQMSNLAGIECEIVHGFSKFGNYKIKRDALPNHSWNAVKLNEKWYLCDATWSSGTIDMTTYQFISEYKDAYFLMEPVLFAENHVPQEGKWKFPNSCLPANNTEKKLLLQE